MLPRTDVCDKCERFRSQVMSAVSEQQKAVALASFSDHLQHAQRERDHYQECTTAAAEELRGAAIAAPPQRPCSRDLTKTHYTFDFAQLLQLPHSSRQVGPIYFKTPRKVHLFGVCNEGVPHQLNYPIDEAQTIGQNGTKSHGANAVVSLLHHYFAWFGQGEQQCVLHADNCGGQNKNKTVIAYCAWRVICSLHHSITLSFMIAGHTRCLVDGHFGLLKRKYRRSDVHSIPQLEAAVNDSAATNTAHVVDGNEIWRAWDVFFAEFFRPVPNVQKRQHFRFDHGSPGQVFVRGAVDMPEEAISLLKANVSLADCPKEKPSH